MDKNSEKLQSLVRDLVPVNGLASQYQTELINQSEIIKLKRRQLAFKQGDRDNASYYLLQGELDLVSDEQLVKQVVGGTDTSRYALAQLQPRQMSGKARTSCVMFKVDRHLLDRLLTLDDKGEGGQVEVSEIDAEESVDWMTKLLQSELFARIPPANIQRIFTTMESVEVEAGEVVVEQGSAGDYYYFIQHGRCDVSRKVAPDAEPIQLAELSEGDSFGEEALVSDVVRNASITMLTDGTLMRLTKQDFVDLIKKPVLNSVSYLGAEAKVAEGAVWLDVRFPEEHADSGMAGSINVPLNTLRLKVTGLDAEKTYVVYCDTGGRSSVAAFLLTQSGINACHLSGGLMKTPLAKQASTRSALQRPAASASTKPKQEEPAPPPPEPTPEDEALDADIRASAITTELAKADLQLQDAMKHKAEAEHAQRQVRQAREQLVADAARLKQQAEAARRKLAEAAKGKIREEREKLEQEAKRLKEEAEAAKVAAEATAAQKLEEERAKLEEQTAEAVKALDEAKRLRFELEAAKREADEEAQIKRLGEEERLTRLKDDAEERLRAESQKLEEEYTRNAEELSRVRQEREEAEAKLRVERANMESAAADAQKKLEEARRLKQQTEASRRAVEIEVEQKRLAQEEMERKMREEVNQKINDERRKLESEFARHAEEMERVGREREAADAARLAAQDEAARIIAEYKEAHDRTVAEQEVALREERERIEQEARGVREAMERAESAKAEASKAREEAEATRRSAEQRIEELHAAQAKAAESKQAQQEDERRSAAAKAAEEEEEKRLRAELAAIDDEVRQAKAELQAAERAAVAAQAAHKANAAEMSKQLGAEEELKLQLEFEAQEWRDEMDEKEREMDKAHDLVLEKEQIERIKRRAQEAKRVNAEANENLLGEISAQLDAAEPPPWG